LKKILERIFIEIELHTLKGRAIFYGFLLCMKRKLYSLKELIENTARALAVGISYLNNPIAFRPYG